MAGGEGKEEEMSQAGPSTEPLLEAAAEAESDEEEKRALLAEENITQMEEAEKVERG